MPTVGQVTKCVIQQQRQHHHAPTVYQFGSALRLHRPRQPRQKLPSRRANDRQRLPPASPTQPPSPRPSANRVTTAVLTLTIGALPHAPLPPSDGQQTNKGAPREPASPPAWQRQ